MANARNGGKVRGKKSSERFVKLPAYVLQSQAYRALGVSARALLVDMLQGHNGSNNGRLLASMAYLTPLGWRSSATVAAALKELIGFGFLIKVRQGGIGATRTACYYAVTWLPQQYDEFQELARPHPPGNGFQCWPPPEK